MIYKFPKNFLFGVGTSSYQIEGNNTNCDWWYSELYKPKGQKYPAEKSGIANDFWHRYEEDIDLVSELGCEAFRLSLEWSRIEPREGYFDEEAVFHYKKILEYARSKKLKIFLTLHHFTIPLWFELKGGFSNINSPKYFSNYALKCVTEFKEYVDYFATINEPEVLAFSGYITGEWPPFKKNKLVFLYVLNNLHRCHNLAFKTIKSKFKAKVGIVINITCFQPKEQNFWNKFLASLIQNIFINSCLSSVRKNLDFIGLNFYQTQLVSGLNISKDSEPQDDMGWYLNFDSLRIVLNNLKKFNLPILITENGLADSHDTLRKWYLKYMIISVYEALKDGVNVKGYFHWTLTDNYEWQHGYEKKFGLVSIDRKHNLKRVKKKSFAYYQLICKTKQVID